MNSRSQVLYKKAVPKISRTSEENIFIGVVTSRYYINMQA